MSHLETKEFILFALDSAVEYAVEKAALAPYAEARTKYLYDMKSLRRAIEVISSLSEADVLCAPSLD